MYAASAKLCRIDSVAIRGDFRIRFRRFFHYPIHKLSLRCQETAMPVPLEKLDYQSEEQRYSLLQLSFPALYL